MIQLFLFLILLPCYVMAYFPIECSGKTDITYVNEEKDTWHKVTCFDPVEINWDQKVIRCIDCKTNEHQKIHYQDAERELFADNLTAHYQLDGKKLILDRLLIYGDVELLEKEEDHLQYALADQMEYDHKNRHLLLEALPGSNVLYFDEKHQYKISAPKVIMKQVKGSKKPSIEGVGAVRFTFKEEELRKFKQHFVGSIGN